MAISTIIKTIKEIHPKDLILVKIGSFYHIYGKDAYIISYLFGYKLKTFEKKYVTCGFPINCISRIMARLEEKKINYITLDRRNNYEKDEQLDNRNLNQYDLFYEKAKKYVNLKIRIDNIYQILTEDLENEDVKEKIIKVEEIVYEGRKI